jgi:uncharacterized lipoprotein NlpE involved in copper resistance
MKSIITLSAITGLAALALVGCNQSNSDSSTNVPSTNASAVNNVPDVNTNLPAGTNQ